MNIVEEFQTRAKAAGLTEDQIKTFVAENFQPQEKEAATTLDSALDQFLDEVGVEKSAEAKAYVSSFLKTAMEAGVEPETAVALSKKAIELSFSKADTEVNKQAASALDIETASYLDGVYEKAASYGLTPEQTTAILQKNSSFGAFLGSAGPAAAAALKAAAPAAAHAAPAAAAAAAPAAAAAAKGGGLMTALKAMGLLGAGGVAGAGGHHLLSTPPTPLPPGLLASLKDYAVKEPAMTAAGGGASIGALLGALSGEDEHEDPDRPGRRIGGSRLRNAGIGALLGAGTGLSANALNPDMFKPTVA